MKNIKIPKNFIDKFNIKESWFDTGPDSIHGVLHGYRVLVFSFFISEQEKANTEALCQASIFHDTKRFNDDYDPEHAFRAAEWIKRFKIKDFDKVQHIIKWHASEDHETFFMTKDLKCFKDADALDRFRSGDLNPSYLRLESSKRMLGFSEKLFQETEKQKNNHNNYKDNIIASLQSLDLLI
jgi:uncharacterized protein